MRDNISSKQTEHGTYRYDYDDLSRLTTADNPDSTDEHFTYDAVGNRLTSADTTTEWTYNQNNELGTADNAEYGYDANGSMIQKTVGGVVTKFFYNLENRLEHIEDGSGNVIASYYYDPFGRRLWKDVGGVRKNFQYSDEGLISEYSSAGIESKTYGYKPGSTWTTDPLFMKENGEHYFYQNDHLGTPQKLVMASGNIVWAAKYNVFGKANISVELVGSNLRFGGQYFDDESSLNYNYYRYYDYRSGRFLSADPIGFVGGINSYSYAFGNPVFLSDTYGLNPLADIVNGIGTAAIEGAKGGVYAVGQAFKVTNNLYEDGPFLAQSALVLAKITTDIPLSVAYAPYRIGKSTWAVFRNGKNTQNVAWYCEEAPQNNWYNREIPGRRGAFRQAKRDSQIEMNQHPQDIQKVPMRSAPYEGGRIIKDTEGNVVYTREYHYTNNRGQKIVIQDHSAGHGDGYQQPHFNVRPIENTRTGKVPGTQSHYPFSR